MDIRNVCAHFIIFFGTFLQVSANTYTIQIQLHIDERITNRNNKNGANSMPCSISFLKFHYSTVGKNQKKSANFIGSMYIILLFCTRPSLFNYQLAISMGKMICADRYFPRTNQKFLKIVSVILQSIQPQTFLVCLLLPSNRTFSNKCLTFFFRNRNV